MITAGFSLKKMDQTVEQIHNNINNIQNQEENSNHQDNNDIQEKSNDININTSNASNSINNQEKFQPSKFKFYDFSLEVGESRFACEIMKMKDSVYVWIGDASERKMNDLSVAFNSPYQSIPIATKIMGPTVDSASSNVAKRLSKKSGMAVYVSFNVATDNLTLMGIEKSLQKELKERPYILQPQ